MNPTLEATQTGADSYQVDVRPDLGVPVTLYVVPVTIPRRGRVYSVQRTPDPAGGFITRHSTFETAAKAATTRAKKYLASCARTAKRRGVKA